MRTWNSQILGRVNARRTGLIRRLRHAADVGERAGSGDDAVVTEGAVPPQRSSAAGVPSPEQAVIATYLRWAGLRAALHRGYWLVASLYLVLDAGLTPAQLVLIGVGQGIVSLIFEIPTGVVADTISRRWSLVLFHALVG